MKMKLKLLFALLYLLITFNSSLLWAQDVNNIDESAITEIQKEDLSAGKEAAPEEELKQTEEEKNWTPSATEFDWVQLSSGEWLKGEIKSMYNEKLEFDSDKLNLLTIKMEDVRYLQSFLPILLNIENLGAIKGKLNISEDSVTVTNGENVRTFDIIEIISFAPGGESESDLWSLKFTLGLDARQGNTSQIDYSSKFSAKRRTAESNFFVDYIGNISKTDAVSGELEETINNHRVNFNLDRYVTRYFFYTPIFGEYYTDAFQNIDKRYSLGVGIGYTLINSEETDWRVSAGPSYLSTKYISVQAGDDRLVETLSLALSTDYDSELTDNIDFIFKYNIQLSSKDSGGYTHHVIATFESEITDDFDFDVSLIWDRINQPTIDQDQNTPEKDDYRMILGITYTY